MKEKISTMLYKTANYNQKMKLNVYWKNLNLSKHFAFFFIIVLTAEIYNEN